MTPHAPLLLLLGTVAAGAISPVCLNGTSISVCASVDGAAVLLSSFTFRVDSRWTTNLAASGDSDSVSLGTLLVQESPNQLYSTASATTAITAVSSTSLTVTGILYGAGASPVASENWTISLSGDSFIWSTSRAYLNPVTLLSDRLSLAVMTVAAPPIYGSQVPSFINNAMLFDFERGAGFPAFGASSPAHNFEFIAATDGTQLLKFQPANTPFVWTGNVTRSGGGGGSAPAWFSFAKPYADGTATCVALGAQGVDRRDAAGVAVAAGDTQSMVMTLTRLNGSDAQLGIPTLNLTLPNATLQGLVEEFVAVQNMFAGWIFGNNPASVPCLHEMSWFSLIAGMFPPNAANIAAVAREVEYIGACGWDDGHGGQSCTIGNSSLLQRWASSGFYNCQWGPLQDQSPHFIIAVHATLLSTGNVSWVADRMPALLAIATYLRSNGIDDTGVFLVPGASGLADGGRHTTNWYDIVEFGHADAFLNALIIWAMQCMTDIFAFTGDTTHAAEYSAIVARMQAAFNATFWDGATAQYYDWVDVAGNPRSYLFTDIAFMAVLTNTSSTVQAAAVISHIDTRVDAIATAYNLTRDDIWAMPCSLYGVQNPLEFAIPVADPVPFPTYENGGAFFHTIGFEAVARGAIGTAGDAYTSFERFMTRGFTQNRAWAQQLYWNANQLVGTDPLNNALLALWGFLRACLGFWVTLTGGIVPLGTPAPQCEGAQYTFAYLGQPACVAVRGGVMVRC